MRLLITASLALIAVSLTLPLSAQLSDPCYVSIECGSPGGDGSPDSPIDSIQAALSHPMPPQEIFVLPNAAGNPYSGTGPDGRILLPANPPYQPTIIALSGPGETFCLGFEIPLNVGCTIEGFDISNPCGYGIKIDGRDGTGQWNHIFINNCEVHHCGDHGIWIKRHTNLQTTDDSFWLAANCVVWANLGSGFHFVPASNRYPSGCIDSTLIGANGAYGLGSPTPNFSASPIQLNFTRTFANTLAPTFPASTTAYPELESIETATAPSFVDVGLGDFWIDCPPGTGNCHLDEGNPTRPDPDGSRNAIGSFGGPRAVQYFSCGATTAGPVVNKIQVDTCPTGGQLTIRVWASN